MVASTHWLASAAGMSVLERGGNAADAAVAAGFVLQVVEPHLNGPGGDQPLLVADPREDDVKVVCGQGVSPAAATLEHFAGLGLDLVPGTGLLPATVPGAFGAWTLLLERWGTWSLRDVLEPAIGYAERGWPLLPTAARTIATVEELFRDEWTESAKLWLAGGLPSAGQRMTNPDLAATYRRVIEEAEAAGGDRETQLQAARDAWYRGFVAEAVAAHCGGQEFMDTSGQRHAGLLTGDDLASWEPTVEDALTYDYHGTTVAKAGPWSQAPVFLQQLALLQGFDLTAMGVGSADYVHTTIEAAKLAFADREAWYGDPQHVDVPMDDLLSDAYTRQRRELISDTASYELRPGAPGGRESVLPPLVGAADQPAVPQAAGVGEPTVARNGETRGDTVHLDVVDKNGLMVSATPSGGWLQSSPVIPGLGFCLGTRGQMFWLAPDLPASLRPRTRPRTTLSPSLALRDGKPWLSFGTPGGDQQDQWTLVFFLHLIHGEDELQRAIDAPMWHSVHFPSSFYPRESYPGRLHIEDRIGEDVVAELRRRGHDVDVVDGWSLGRISAAGHAAHGFLRAAANPRGAQGYAVGR
ncbi:MAG: gamma-glutamyltransferase family protein [Motilibacteraceae bacterium]